MEKETSLKPHLTVILPLYNAEKELHRFFEYYGRQKFGPYRIELLVLDGGSSDKTVKIAKKHGARVLNNPERLTEPAVALGFREARAPIVMVMAADNLYPDPDAIRTILDIFKDPHITAVFPRHASGPGDSLISRYENAFTDPVTHFVYLNAANARTFRLVYKTLKHTDVYDIYDFRNNPIKPVLALAQGFTIRTSHMPARRENSDDVLTVYELIEKGETIAFAHAVDLYHYTLRDMRHFITKLHRAVENALLRKNSGIMQRSAYLTPAQKLRRALFIPYAVLIVPAAVVSVLKYITTGERMWLYHWYVSFITAIIIIRASVPLLLKANE